MSEIAGINTAQLASMSHHSKGDSGGGSAANIAGGTTDKVRSSKIGGDTMTINMGSIDYQAPTLGADLANKIAQSGTNYSDDIITSMFGDKPIVGNELASGIKGEMPQLQHTAVGAQLNAPTGSGTKGTERSAAGGPGGH